LKTFKVTIHHPKAPVIKEIIWQFPLHNWTKCNIDGACTGNSGNASCSGIFRNRDAGFMFCFVEPLRNSSQYQAKLCGALRATELAYQMNWKNLRLETDSTLMVSAFKNTLVHVAWNIRNRWHNTMILFRKMNYIVSHIHREGNQVADLLAGHGLSLLTIFHWNDAPDFLRNSIIKIKLGLTKF
jgi:ribonuclease HI